MILRQRGRQPFAIGKDLQSKRCNLSFWGIRSAEASQGGILDDCKRLFEGWFFR